MEIDRIEHITRLNQWLEIIHGTPDALSWPDSYERKEAYELYKYFKNQPERLSPEDDRNIVCDSLNSMET